MHQITLEQDPYSYAVSRLAHDSVIPDWVDGKGFVTISRSRQELSIVCRADRVPAGIQSEQDWVCWRFVGPFAFGATGIVLSVIEPLSRGGIGIFVVSTFDGDHLLLQRRDLERALPLLTAAGHRFITYDEK
ncbi:MULTISPECIES: ACT domain-containing protein [unclassified Janthinobacterium]|uniref:ACT domain-containing protein n=1 Tax=unclassified Janthinobacterium TaxID=2610881 RepID=UPI000B819182|nr:MULTISPECIES: ACT domain-containing protein [unclassified Janthinobacterium]